MAVEVVYHHSFFSSVDIDLGGGKVCIANYCVILEGVRTSYLCPFLSAFLMIARAKITNLSIKELLYARQTLLPIDAQPRHRPVYWVFRNRKDDRWDIVIMEE